MKKPKPENKKKGKAAAKGIRGRKKAGREKEKKVAESVRTEKEERKQGRKANGNRE